MKDLKEVIEILKLTDGTKTYIKCFIKILCWNKMVDGKNLPH